MLERLASAHFRMSSSTDLPLAIAIEGGSWHFLGTDAANRNPSGESGLLVYGALLITFCSRNKSAVTVS